MTEKEIRKLMFPNKETETLLRKWQRKLKGSLSEEHRQKCLYYIKLYS